MILFPKNEQFACNEPSTIPFFRNVVRRGDFLIEEGEKEERKGRREGKEKLELDE